MLASCTEKEPDLSAVDRYNQGVAFLEAGDYKNAIIEFEAVLNADPNNFEAKKNLAGAYANDGNYDAARQTYLDARDMRPNDASIFSNLAYVYYMLGEQQYAWDNLANAFSNDPNYPLAHYVAAELYFDQDETQSALAEYETYLGYESNSRFSRDATARIQMILGDDYIMDDNDGDGESDDESLEEDSEAGNHEEVAEEESEDGNPDEALEEEEITEDELTGEESEGTEEEADSADDESEENADDEASEDESDEEDEEDEVAEPELPQLSGDELYQDRLSRGRRERAIGNYSRAIQYLLEAYGVHPDYAQVNYELGKAYYGGEQIEQAKIYFNRFLDFGTDPSLISEVEGILRDIERGPEESSSEEDETSSDDTPSDEEEDDDTPDEIRYF